MNEKTISPQPQAAEKKNKNINKEKQTSSKPVGSNKNKK